MQACVVCLVNVRAKNAPSTQHMILCMVPASHNRGKQALGRPHSSTQACSCSSGDKKTAIDAPPKAVKLQEVHCSSRYFGDFPAQKHTWQQSGCNPGRNPDAWPFRLLRG